MMKNRFIALVVVGTMNGCTAIQDYSAPVAGTVGAYQTASALALLEAQYYGGALIAYAIYDPLAPNWRITATPLDENRVRLDMRMKALTTGGEGEARMVFLRSARRLAEEGQRAGFDVLRFEEGIESTRPFARRFASGEVHLAHSLIWPELEPGQPEEAAKNTLPLVQPNLVEEQSL